MSKIQVNVEDLKNFADIIGDIENQCDDALRHLNWDFSSFLADLPGVSPKRVKEVEEIYRSVIKKYQAKLDHAQQLVKRTEAAMRQAEKNIGEKAGEFGLEMLGYYDVQRVFGEYDPITGEKVSGADRLLATGMLALSIYPPGKAVGVTGKVAIKGANAGTKTGTKFGLSFIAKSPKVFQSLKNVVSTGKVLEVFKGVYKQVVEAPLAATKLWMDRTVRQIADFWVSVFGTQLATPMGAVPRNTVGNAFGEAKDAFVKMVKTGEVPVVTKGTGNPVTKRSIKQNEVTTYQDFVDRSVVGDNLEGHEVWQHANLKANGLATNRLSTEASKNNPVIALEREQHKLINKAQRGIDATNQLPLDNILSNSKILRDVGISDVIVNDIKNKALIHMKNTLE